MVSRETSGKAIASLIFGLFSLTVVAAIPAIVFGHVALSQIKKSAGRLTGRGLAIAGLVFGYLGIAAIPFILIIAAIAIPNLLRARIAANEASSVGAIRSINAAEITYSTAHPETGFTCNLEALSSSGLDSSITAGSRHGYVFTLQNCEPEAAGGANMRFQVVAYPETENQTGVRAFCSNESGVIKYSADGSPQACVEQGAELQ